MKPEEAVAYLQDCLENELFTDDEAEAIRALLEGFWGERAEKAKIRKELCKRCCIELEGYCTPPCGLCEWRGPEPGGEEEAK